MRAAPAAPRSIITATIPRAWWPSPTWPTRPRGTNSPPGRASAAATATSSPPPSARFSRIRSGCSTCTAMFGNGAATGSARTTTPSRPRRTRPGRRPAQSVSSGAAAGTTPPPCAARPSVIGMCPAIAITSWASASRPTCRNRMRIGEPAPRTSLVLPDFTASKRSLRYHSLAAALVPTFGCRKRTARVGGVGGRFALVEDGRQSQRIAVLRIDRQRPRQELLSLVGRSGLPGGISHLITIVGRELGTHLRRGRQLLGRFRPAAVLRIDLPQHPVRPRLLLRRDPVRVGNAL